MVLNKKYLESSIKLPYFKNKTDNLFLYNSLCKDSSITIIKYLHAKKLISFTAQSNC